MFAAQFAAQGRRVDNAPMAKPVPRLAPAEVARIIDTAWNDKPPFNAVLLSHGLNEGQLVALLRRELTPSAYKTWTQRWRTRR